MQVTNGDVWTVREPLKTLLNEKLPVKTAYWLARLARQVQSRVAVIEEVRNRLITEYGAPNEKGQIEISGESSKWADFVAAHNELMGEPADIDCIDKKIVLQASNGLCMKSTDLMALEPFVELEMPE